ncbi:hypothetical protein Pint_02497 [Pistacia integerrima]|jgi:hypothetical protein
MKPT